MAIAWEDIKDKAAATGKQVVNKTKDLTEMAKLKLAINNSRKKITVAYAKIGKAYALENAENPDKLLPEEFAAIDEANAKINECKERLRELKGVVACPACDAEVPGDDNFCPKCGKEMPKEAPEADAE